jgi:hypothetical protein
LLYYRLIQLDDYITEVLMRDLDRPFEKLGSGGGGLAGSPQTPGCQESQRYGNAGIYGADSLAALTQSR